MGSVGERSVRVVPSFTNWDSMGDGAFSLADCFSKAGCVVTISGWDLVTTPPPFLLGAGGGGRGGGGAFVLFFLGSLQGELGAAAYLILKYLDVSTVKKGWKITACRGKHYCKLCVG